MHRSVIPCTVCVTYTLSIHYIPYEVGIVFVSHILTDWFLHVSHVNGVIIIMLILPYTSCYCLCTMVSVIYELLIVGCMCNWGCT